MKKNASFTLLGVTLIIVITVIFFNAQRQKPTIRIGILHSLTGTMAESEKGVVDATLLAIEEINANGGLMGQQLEAVIVDGQSNDSIFANEAERLITQEKVVAVFGCWTSAARKKVKPIFEKYNNLLFYPVQYEGLEKSPNIIYLGATPNQQIIPAVKWAFENLGQRFVLVGSDYVFPRTANEIIKQQISVLNGSVVGEFYQVLSSDKFDKIVNEIKRLQPDVILNSINGDSNTHFYNALRKAGIKATDIPVLSFSIAEDQIKPSMIGDYAAWNYFQNLQNPQNNAFVSNFKKRFGQERMTADPLEAAYAGVYFWKSGVERAKSVNPELVRKALRFTSIPAPSGAIAMDSDTQHIWKTARIGKVSSTLQFDVVWEANKPTWANPYPTFKSQAEWSQFLQHLYQRWGQKWSLSP